MMVFKGTVSPHPPRVEMCCIQDPCCLSHQLLWVRAEMAADISAAVCSGAPPHETGATPGVGLRQPPGKSPPGHPVRPAMPVLPSSREGRSVSPSVKWAWHGLEARPLPAPSPFAPRLRHPLKPWTVASHPWGRAGATTAAVTPGRGWHGAFWEDVRAPVGLIHPRVAKPFIGPHRPWPFCC